MYTFFKCNIKAEVYKAHLNQVGVGKQLNSPNQKWA